MNLGSTVAISISQSIFHNYLPPLLSQYAPGVNATSVLEAGAANIRGLVAPEQLPGLLIAYSKALTQMFVSTPNPWHVNMVLTLLDQYLPAACSALACLASIWLGWERVKTEGEKGDETAKTEEKDGPLAVEKRDIPDPPKEELRTTPLICT